MPVVMKETGPSHSTPGRRFQACQRGKKGPPYNGCGYFKWQDEAPTPAVASVAGQGWPSTLEAVFAAMCEESRRTNQLLEQWLQKQ